MLTLQSGRARCAWSMREVAAAVRQQDLQPLPDAGELGGAFLNLLRVRLARELVGEPGEEIELRRVVARDRRRLRVQIVAVNIDQQTFASLLDDFSGT